MFGDSSDEEDEVLTPSQRSSSAEPAPPPRDNAATSSETAAPADTAAPTDPINPSASKVPKIVAEFVIARFSAYKRRAKKDNKGKAKNSSYKASSPSASHSGIGTPAPDTATIPSTYNQYNQGSHSSTAPQQPFNTGMAPPPNPMPWGAGGPYSGTQGLPSYSNPFSGFNFTMPQQSAVPPWLHSQWTALPYQGLGVAPPPMDRYWSFNQPQHG